MEHAILIAGGFICLACSLKLLSYWIRGRSRGGGVILVGCGLGIVSAFYLSALLFWNAMQRFFPEGADLSFMEIVDALLVIFLLHMYLEVSNSFNVSKE